MATKRIKDLTTTATALDLVSSRYGVIDTPDITKKLPGNLLIGSGSGGGGLFQFVPGTTTFSDILPALEEGKMFVLVHELPSGETSENYYIGVTSNTLNSVSRIVLVNVNQTDMTFYAVDNSDNWTGPSSVSIDASGKVALIETPEDLADFYHGMVQHVRKCIEDGWSVKDSVDYDNLLNQIDE